MSFNNILESLLFIGFASMIGENWQLVTYGPSKFTSHMKVKA